MSEQEKTQGVVSRGDDAINERYRPRRFSEMIGNDKIKKSLTEWMNDPKRSRALLLAGSSSAGKTTTSRILAMGLNCLKGDTVEPCLECENCKMAMQGRFPGTALHIVEENMSDTNKLEDVQRIVAKMNATALTGRNQVFILDEVQRLTTAAQNVLLKPTENPPPGVYIVYCTTEPTALIDPLRNRCQKYFYSLPTDRDVAKILKDVTQQEGIEMTPEQKRALYNAVCGMPYRDILFAVKQFHSGMGIDEIELLGKDENEITLFEIAKSIVYKGDYNAYLDLLSSGVNIELEKLRITIRTMAGKEIEKAGFANSAKAATYCQIVDLLDSRPFYTTPPRPTASSVLFQVCALVKGA